MLKIHDDADLLPVAFQDALLLVMKRAKAVRQPPSVLSTHLLVSLLVAKTGRPGEKEGGGGGGGGGGRGGGGGGGGGGEGEERVGGDGRRESIPSSIAVLNDIQRVRM